MAKVIEPPVLMSRTLTFVLAASVMVLAVLVFTLTKMAPLTKPEVFFLQNQSRNVNYVLEQPSPTEREFHKKYIEGFIRTYIIARNTLDVSTPTTLAMWNNIVKPWSSDAVYKKFKETNTYNDVSAYRLHNISCQVYFDQGNISSTGGVYRVPFTRICKNQNSGGQIEQKSYMIQIAIQSYLDNESDTVLNNLEELRNNPLGIQVTEYTVTNNKGVDPLSDLEPDFYKEGL